MDLSIIILNYRSKGLCKTCLRGILKIPFDLKYEIIVLDNGSNDGIDEMMAKDYPDIPYIQTGSNLGHSAGNNLGIQAAKGDYLLILNPDITVTDRAFETMVQYMKQHPEVGVVGCKLLNPDKSIQYSCRRFYRPLTPLLSRTFLGKTSLGQKHMDHFLMKDMDHNQTQPVNWVQGSCMMIKKSLINEIGAFDERFFLYFSDVDLCFRAWTANWEVHYLAEARVIHYFHRESAGGLKILLNRIGRIHIKDWVTYLKKHLSKPLLYDTTAKRPRA